MSMLGSLGGLLSPANVPDVGTNTAAQPHPYAARLANAQAMQSWPGTRRAVIEIHEADNGFMVYVASSPGNNGRTYVAADVEGLQQVIALALVNRKMDEVK
jgi:hypothetical protein